MGWFGGGTSGLGFCLEIDFTYHEIPTFKEYVLIDQERYVVDVYYKPDQSDLWRITRYEDPSAIIHLSSLGIDVSMELLYKHVRFDGVASDDQ